MPSATIMHNYMYVHRVQMKIQTQSIVFDIGKTIVRTIYLLSNDTVIRKTIFNTIYLLSDDPTIGNTK